MKQYIIKERWLYGKFYWYCADECSQVVNFRPRYSCSCKCCCVRYAPTDNFVFSQWKQTIIERWWVVVSSKWAKWWKVEVRQRGHENRQLTLAMCAHTYDTSSVRNLLSVCNAYSYFMSRFILVCWLIFNFLLHIKI